MKTIQMTLDDKLVLEVDKVVKNLHTNRSAFTRKALQNAISCYYVEQLEEKQINGYKNKPVQENEFNDFENEQVWGDQ